jgi:hypothetical protein
MIQMPRRSVTRFFIPLIDVLTLLLAMFLLMPIFDEEARQQEDTSPSPSEGVRKDLEIARLSRLLGQARQQADPLTEKERQELQRLRREMTKPLPERYAVFVLGIDAKNGNLFYYDPLEADKKIVIAKAEDADRLIKQQRGLAGDRDLYFLFQEPRQKSAFPIGKQRKLYESWFKSVPHGFESPGGRP